MTGCCINGDDCCCLDPQVPDWLKRAKEQTALRRRAIDLDRARMGLAPVRWATEEDVMKLRL